MKSCVIFFCVILLCAGLRAQTKGYTRYLTNSPDSTDPAFIDQLIQHSVDIYLQYPDSARSFAEKALLLSKQVKYQNGIGASFAAIGYTYWVQAYYSISLYYLFDAADYLKTGKKYADLSMCYRIITRNYLEMEKYNLARSYLHESQIYAVLSKDNRMIAIIYNESSLIDVREKNYSGALEKGKTALALSFKYQDTLLTGIIYSRLADVLKEMGEYSLVKNYYDSAYRWSILANNNRLRCLLFNNFAEYYIRSNEIDKAIGMANAASRLADSTGILTVKIKSAELIATCFHLKKDINKELEYQIKYNSLQDSIEDIYKRKGFELFQQFFALNRRLYDIEIKEHENVISKERLRFQHITIIALVMFIIILLAGLATIFYLYKEKKRVFEQLADRNSAITQQKNIIEEQSEHLVQLNNLKTKLFAVISHDLRTPITSLRSIMGLFQQHDLNEEQTVVLLKRMLPALDGADLTLSNLLNWSVKQMNGLKINRSTVSLFPAVREMGRVFEFALTQKNISLVNNVSPETKAWFDEQHLTIILRNLVSNAIKFTPKNGSIVVWDKLENNKVILSVEDTGQGISAGNISKLFVATNYFSTPGTGGEKGTGLGLLLCKELLELNNGTISVQSTPGIGSIFCIILPEKESK